MAKLQMIGIGRNVKKNFVIGLAAGLLFISVAAIANLRMLMPMLDSNVVGFFTFISAIIVVGFVAPALEEPLMAVVLHISRSVVSSIAIAILITAFVFAAFHMEVYGVSNIDFFIGAFVFRVIASIIMIKTECQLPAMVMHSVANIYLFTQYYLVMT